jgi:hypothetical protein
VSINESQQLCDNFVRRVLDAIRNDDFEFIEESIEHYPDAMSKVAGESKLLIKAFTAGAVKSFKVLVSELDFDNKASQLSNIETLIKQRLSTIAEADNQNICDELDMIAEFSSAEFSSAELEQDIYEIAKNSIEVTVHILLFRAFLRAEGIEPYDYLQLVKTEKETVLCMELIAS